MSQIKVFTSLFESWGDFIDLPEYEKSIREAQELNYTRNFGYTISVEMNFQHDDLAPTFAEVNAQIDEAFAEIELARLETIERLHQRSLARLGLAFNWD